MKNLLHKIINRKVITALLIAVQIAWCISLIYNTALIYPILNTFFYVVGISVVIYIISKDSNPSYKLAWILPIMVFPVFGVVIYLLYANKKPSRYLRRRFAKAGELVTQNLRQACNAKPQARGSGSCRDACARQCACALPQQYGLPRLRKYRSKIFPLGRGNVAIYDSRA